MSVPIAKYRPLSRKSGNAITAANSAATTSAHAVTSSGASAPSCCTLGTLSRMVAT